MNHKKRLVLLGLSMYWLLGWRFVHAQSDLFGLLNDLRGSKGLPAYSWQGALAAAAQSQAQWMVENNCAIAHVHPDGSSPRSRAAAFGYATSDVSENIYCGTNASRDSAWQFWLNSGIHYAGLVNTRYKEVGAASASGGGWTAYVLVFGNPGGPAYVPPSANNGNNNGAASGPPSYVLGVDAHGNILHEIQPGDTLGDIMLIYGYTWSEIPYVLEINGLKQTDVRDLEIGAVLLVPPKAGTYTPTPGDPPTATPTFTLTPPAETYTPPPTPTVTATPLPSATPSPTLAVGATAGALPADLVALLVSATPTATALLAASPTPTPTPTVVTTRNNSAVLLVVVAVQAVLIVVAGVALVVRRNAK